MPMQLTWPIIIKQNILICTCEGKNIYFLKDLEKILSIQQTERKHLCQIHYCILNYLFSCIFTLHRVLSLFHETTLILSGCIPSFDFFSCFCSWFHMMVFHCVTVSRKKIILQLFNLSWLCFKIIMLSY